MEPVNGAAVSNRDRPGLWRVEGGGAEAWF